MNKRSLTNRFSFALLLLLLASCGGGGSSSSGSDASEINVWLGKWGLVGGNSNICGGNSTMVSGEFNFNQSGSGINGNYSVRVTCRGAGSATVNGTVNSTLISRDQLVLVDDEKDIITFSRTAGEVFGMKIVDPDSGSEISSIAFKK